MTACRDCKHFLYVTKNPNFGEDDPIWYSMFCKASPIPPEFDPYTGKFEKGSEEFHFCRDINKGDCPKFEYK
jgi:hypothetical protein